MKFQVTFTFLALFAFMQVSAQRRTEIASPWVKDTAYYFAKHGSDFNKTDTLVVVPWRPAWRSCCLVLCGGVRNVGWNTPFLMDVGVYRTNRGETTFKGGVGAYLESINTITTIDYHYAPWPKSSQVAWNVLYQLLPVRWAGGTQTVHMIRMGMNVGYYMPRNVQGRPYIEPKLGMIMPFGRSHLYAGYRFLNTDNEAFVAAQGWHFGMTALLTHQ